MIPPCAVCVYKDAYAYCIWLKASRGPWLGKVGLGKEVAGASDSESSFPSSRCWGIPPPLPACLSLPSSSHHLGPVRPFGDRVLRDSFTLNLGKTALWDKPLRTLLVDLPSWIHPKGVREATGYEPNYGSSA